MTDGGWNFGVVRVDLDGLSINAGQRLGMVIVQPEYKLDPDAAIPFRISNECRGSQKELIEKAFQIRAAEMEGRNVPIPFIIFPEAAIPVSNPDGLDCLREQMEQIQGDVVFIGGLEGLSPQEAREVADRFTPRVDVGRAAFGAGAFVNVCVIAVKSVNGDLDWHFQAKLRPSRSEQQRNMAHGQRVMYFVAPNIAFLCQICFDHIAAEGEEPLNTALYRQVIKTTQLGAPILDFIFVSQCNPQPAHSSVRENTSYLLKDQGRAIKNETLAVVVVNKAASVQEPSEYGRSGFHYRSGRWQIPTTDIGPKGYELYDSDDVTSAVFRKRTQAIHVATFVPPSHNIGDPGNPRQPLENPRSYLIGEVCDPTPCSCLPGTTCEVGRFVECDCLPCKLRDTLLAALPTKDEKKRWEGLDVDQSQLLETNYEQIREGLLILGCTRAREVVYLLLQMHDSDKRNNPDLWSGSQSEAVVEFLAALSVLTELKSVDFNTSPQWTARLGESLAIAVLDGEDKKYSWARMEDEYIKRFGGQYHRPDARTKPVLLVALRSGGLVRPLVQPRWPDFTKPSGPDRLGDEDSYTKPAEARFYVCQDGLFEGARQGTTIQEFLKSEMRCVLG